MPQLSRRALLARAGAVLLTVVALDAGPAQARSPRAIRVLPLGDSITSGVGSPGGYRVELWRRLVAAGYRVDFVGSQFNGPSTLGDLDHEGHSGWTISEINLNIVQWLRSAKPHTVLLHIGTNDMYSNPTDAPEQLDILLDRITSIAPNADVFVATIIPYVGRETEVSNFNAVIPELVRSRANAGQRIHLVDMFNALTTADLVDGIHPNPTGYAKMGTTWFNALQLDRGGTPGSMKLGQPTGARLSQ